MLHSILAAAGVAAGAADGGDFRLSSEAFSDGATIPAVHTCDGPDRSPPLQWGGAPKEAQAFALVMTDPDAPKGTFTHWVVYNIPNAARALGEAVKPDRELGDGSVQARNDFGATGWGGPCPPPGGEHKYVFILHALSEPLAVNENATRAEILEAVDDKSIAEAKLSGRYQREKPAPNQ